MTPPPTFSSTSSSTPYRALVLDLDGTLVADDGRIHPYTLEAVRDIAERGVKVMIATGRSETSARPVIEELGFETPAVIFNGAAVFCPRAGAVIEQQLLSRDQLGATIDYGLREECLIVTMEEGSKRAYAPPHHNASMTLHDMTALELFDDPEALRERDGVIRTALFSNRHRELGEFAAHFTASVGDHFYLTDFPLRLLPSHRESELMVLDVHPPCPGKARAIELLGERYGIAAEEVVAIGDATNDLPMLAAAGLGVAMETSMAPVHEAADRTIGSHESDAIGRLIDELWRS